jgi:hypothetical protein
MPLGLKELKSPVNESIATFKNNTRSFNSQSMMAGLTLSKHIDADANETESFHTTSATMFDRMKSDASEMYG